MTRYNHSNIAVDTTLAVAIGLGDTAIAVAADTGWPAVPFWAALTPTDASTEELIVVTAAVGLNWTVTRAQGGSTAKTHASGALVRHVITQHDLEGYQLGGREVAATAPNAGDVLTYGPPWAPAANAASGLLTSHAALTTAAHGGIVASSDARLTDARTPTAHASTHASAGSDPVTLAQSQVTSLTADLAAKEPGLGNPASDGLVLSSTALGARSWIAPGGGGTIDGSGAAGRMTEWLDADTLQSSTLIKTGAGLLTLAAAGAFTLTVPATGTAALLGTANLFSATQSFGAFLQLSSGGSFGLVSANAATNGLWLVPSSSPLGYVVVKTDVAANDYLGLGNAAYVAFSSLGGGYQAIDVGIARNAAGVIEIDDGSSVRGRWGALKAGTRDAGTNTITNGLTLGHQSTGTPAAGLGTAVLLNINSSTTADQTAAQLAASWADATHATRKARLTLNVFDTASREGLRVEASGSAPMIGFLGANAVIRQTLSAAASDPGTTQTLVNDIRTALLALGLAA